MEKETYIFSMDKKEIINLLQVRGKEQKQLHAKAARIRQEHVTDNVYFRGLIEFSNICMNDCYYCGIRKSNRTITRYTLSEKEILSCVDFCNTAGYSSVVLQSGERENQSFIDYITHISQTIHQKYPEMAITLCIGELHNESYQQLFDAGVERYLLRIETTNENHYKKLHPEEMSFKNRINCLTTLKKIGFQVGTGVMIGSPYQTLQNLAEDILFMKEFAIDMVGMGPYIPHQEALISATIDKEESIQLSLNMIAVLRILMPDINIAATTALQALNPVGRELGLKAGANVIMPLITPEKYRQSYKLYEGKPCLDESDGQCLTCITSRIQNIGLVPAFNKRGDSLHFKKREEITSLC